MPENVMPTIEIDGNQLRALFAAGARRVMAHRKPLNDINVFPVADADTGTNLSATLRTLLDAEGGAGDVRGAARAMADAALVGARGNSGIVFAEFLQGFAEEIPPGETLGAGPFARGMKRAAVQAREALARPVDGTILTVMRDWAEGLGADGEEGGDYLRRLSEACVRAETSLAGTTARLAALARAGVVDAGGKGFTLFAEGLRDYFREGAETEKGPEASEPVEASGAGRAEVRERGASEFRFCLEAILTGERLDREQIGREIEAMGDSAAMAGSGGKIHVHLHTADPAGAMARLHRLGSVVFQKVDDMDMQRRVEAAPVAEIALLTDSGCDLPQEIIDRHQIHVVPFTIHVGDQYYLDRQTLMPKEFYAMQKASRTRPSTSLPSPGELQERYEYLVARHRSAIAVHFSEHLSGTHAASAKAAREVAERSGKRIDVVNSASLSAGEGLLVHRVAEAIAAGAGHDEILERIPEWKSKIVLRVGFESLDYIAGSGRVSPLKGWIGRVLDLKPAIEITAEGKAQVFAAAFTERGAMEKVMRNLGRALAGRAVRNYALTHARDPEWVAEYAGRMERMTGRKPLFMESSTPGIIANTGPGICIAAMLE